jgi:hypothetical protein
MAERYEERYKGEDWRRERGYGRDYDRGFFERAGDEVRSWFGDDEAERRRRIDEARCGRDWDRYGDRYGREPERYRGEYGRDWDYGHRMGFDYGRPHAARGWGEERSGTGERDYGHIDYWRPGWPASWHDPAYGGSAYTRPGNSGYGPFSGRGPRGYQRTDERLREDVCERLTQDPWIDASDLEVTVRGGEVTLSGAVRDRGDKRHAEDLAERVSGVREVHNNLRVAGGLEHSPTREQTTTAGTPMAGTTSRR